MEYDHIKSERTKIGSGGQGVVYRVDVASPTLPDQIAVKEPAVGSKTIDVEEMEALLEEANTWEDLDRREREKPRWDASEHIVGIIDIGDAEIPWIAMEYMDGGGLDDRLADHPEGLPLAEALWYGESICRGVEVAHNYGIAHLDLKPSNVLFRSTSDGVWDVPKIADWGVSRELTEQTGTMEQLSVLYAAPEQFDREQFGDPDMLTDVYQVGAIVYAMVTGQPPYTGEQASVMHDIVYGDDPTPPGEIREDLPAGIDEVLLKALSKEKTERYRNIGAFTEALQDLRTTESTSGEASQASSTHDEGSEAEPTPTPETQSPDSPDPPNAESPQDQTATTTPDETQKTNQTDTKAATGQAAAQTQGTQTPFSKDGFRLKDKRRTGVILGGIVIIQSLLYIITEIVMDGTYGNGILFLVTMLAPVIGGIAGGWNKLGFSVPILTSIASVVTLALGDFILGETFELWVPIIVGFFVIFPSMIAYWITERIRA